MSLDDKVNRADMASLWRQWNGARQNFLQARDAMRNSQDKIKAARYYDDPDCEQKDIDLVNDIESKLKAIE